MDNKLFPSEGKAFCRILPANCSSPSARFQLSQRMHFPSLELTEFVSPALVLATWRPGLSWLMLAFISTGIMSVNRHLCKWKGCHHMGKCYRNCLRIETDFVQKDSKIPQGWTEDRLRKRQCRCLQAWRNDWRSRWFAAVERGVWHGDAWLGRSPAALCYLRSPLSLSPSCIMRPRSPSNLSAVK